MKCPNSTELAIWLIYFRCFAQLFYFILFFTRINTIKFFLANIIECETTFGLWIHFYTIFKSDLSFGPRGFFKFGQEKIFAIILVELDHARENVNVVNRWINLGLLERFIIIVTVVDKGQFVKIRIILSNCQNFCLCFLGCFSRRIASSGQSWTKPPNNFSKLWSPQPDRWWFVFHLLMLCEKFWNLYYPLIVQKYLF